MKKISTFIKGSLATRLLLVFVLTCICIVAVFTSTLAKGFSSQWRVNVRPHLEQYLDYVISDLGNPPSIEKARELAQRLPINIYINGHDIHYSSTGKKLNLENIEFHSRRKFRRKPPNSSPQRLPNHNKNSLRKKSSVMMGEYNERTILRNQIGDYQVYYELSHTGPSKHRDSIILKMLLAIIAILAISYFILKRMLRPVQDIKIGVQRMRVGELSYRVPVRANNDLGNLSDSINKMADEIEQMLDAKRQLLLAVSHELRSPLTRAKIATQMLEDSNNRDRLQEDLLEMETLITEILETERMNTKHAVLHRQTVDIDALLKSVLQELPSNQVSITTHKQIPSMELDENRIRLLLRNLINNAVIHGGDATPAPSVNLAYENQHIIISVIDHGPGISSEHLSHVTEPFYRADPSRTRDTGGFGIGLYLCKLIAEAHGGQLTVSSELGKGTQVDVQIPDNT